MNSLFNKKQKQQEKIRIDICLESYCFTPIRRLVFSLTVFVQWTVWPTLLEFCIIPYDTNKERFKIFQTETIEKKTIQTKRFQIIWAKKSAT